MKQNKVPKNEYTNGEPSPYRKNPFKKDVFYGDDGQYAHPGQVTRIPGDAFGTHITMKGINQPLYARDDQGNEQMMQPGEEYQFPGQYVTEYPQIAKNGGGLLNKTLTCSSCGWSWKAVDGGKDIASCHKCGGTAKMQKGGANRSDSLALYNNSLQIKNFYDKLKPFYKKPEIDINDYRTTYNPFEDIDSGKTQRETLASDQLTSTNKNIIRANKDPNIQYLSDMVTGMIDPSAPLLKYDKRIKPQGQVLYDPYDPYLNKLTAKNIKYDIPGYTEAEMYFKGIADIPQYRNAAENIAKKSGTSLEELSKLGKLSSKIRKLLPGNITTIPYYDPLAIKPVDLLTEAEKVERIKKYGTSGFPKGYTQAKEEPKMYAKKADYEKSKKQQRIAPISLKKQEVVPQEMVDYLQQKQVDLPTQQQEPELRIPTTPKDTTAGKRIAWRKDPNTKKMVPVIGGMKESVKNMKRLYNKDIPSSTGAIPVDFNPDYGDVATFQNGGLHKAQKGEQVEDNDSWLENIAEIVDPTGISSWDDVYRAYKNKGIGKEVALELLGSIPLLGKVKKAGRLVDDLGNAFAITKRQKNNAKITSGALKGIGKYGPSAGRVTDAVQAILGAKDDSGFTWDLRHGEVPKYGGRNIFPQIDLGEHGDFAYGGSFDMYPFGGQNSKTGTHFQEGGWLDELDEEYKRGGMVNPLMKSRSKRAGTSKNIQSSINKIFLRNHDIFGPGGKNIYNPKSKYELGGGLDEYQNAGSTGVRQPIIPDLTPRKQKVYTDAEAEALNKKALAQSTAQAKKEYIDDYVKQGTKQALLESPFNLAASFTPAGAAMFAGQSGAQAIQDVANKDYLSAGINAAFALPLLKPLKQIKALKGLPKGANTKFIPKGKMEGVGTAKDAITRKSYGPLATPVYEGKYPASTPSGFVKGDYFDINKTGYTDVPGFNQELQQLKTKIEYGKKPLLKDIIEEQQVLESTRGMKDIDTPYGKLSPKNNPSPNATLNHYLRYPELLNSNPSDLKKLMLAIAKLDKKAQPGPIFNKMFPESMRTAIYNNERFRLEGKMLTEMPDMPFTEHPSVKSLRKTFEGFEGDPRVQKKIQQMIDKTNQAKLEFKNPKQYTGKQAFSELHPNKYGGQQKGWLDNLH